ncbi:hypothetical protein LTR50_007723 [Elasticomyces elasticus]|nr:hypothetical protein LTR50_007723 [Elasticomyces elasticus]
MHVAVIGPAGFGGSHVCKELLDRGHSVTGVSRSPEKLGKHERYTPKAVDLGTASIQDVMEAFQGIDVVVNSYNPPGGPTMYKTFLETARKVVTAVKLAKVPYLITIGGTGSLDLGSKYPHQTAADSREFWVAYRRANADSEAATAHMEDRLGPGPMTESMRAYRTARVALKAGKADKTHKKTIKDTEDPILHGADPIPDLPLAARASFLWYEGNETFRWSFVSPPSQYRPGPRTGKYEAVKDVVPMKPESEGQSSDNEFNGRLLGASTADVAVAIVDEADKQERVG